jgi:hypothetical protein
MLDRSNTSQKLKENAVNASELAVQLAQDRKFRKRLLSAVRHSSEAGRRTRENLGMAGTVKRVVADQALQADLRGDDLQQAYARIESKRSSHRLRNVILFVATAAAVAVPEVR